MARKSSNFLSLPAPAFVKANEVAAQFQHEGPILPRDIFGLVAVQVGEPQEMLSVSKGALRSKAGQSSLRVYSDDNGWTDVNVDVGRVDDEIIQITPRKIPKHPLHVPEIVQTTPSN